MFFLENLTLNGCDCGGAGILKIIKFVWQLLDIAFFIVPIGLIVMITVDFAKNVIAGKDDEMKKNVNIVIKRLIYAVALFLVPTIVNAAINVIGNFGVAYSDCITIAKTHNLSQYEDCTLLNLQDENDNINGNSIATMNKDDYYFSSKNSACDDYQPQYIDNVKIEDSKLLVKDVASLATTYKGQENQKIWTKGVATSEYYIWIGDGNCSGEYKNVSSEVLSYYDEQNSNFENALATTLRDDYFFPSPSEKCSPYQPRYINDAKIQDTGSKVSDGCESWKKKYQNQLNGRENQKIWKRVSGSDVTYHVWLGDGNCGGKYLDVTADYCSALN